LIERRRSCKKGEFFHGRKEKVFLKFDQLHERNNRIIIDGIFLLSFRHATEEGIELLVSIVEARDLLIPTDAGEEMNFCENIFSSSTFCRSRLHRHIRSSLFIAR
jgi:hypothetical protein